MLPVLLGGVTWLDPGSLTQVEHVPSRGNDLTSPRPGEQKQSDHVRQILPSVTVKVVDDSSLLRSAQEPLSRPFAIARETPAWIALCPTQTNCNPLHA